MHGAAVIKGRSMCLCMAEGKERQAATVDMLCSPAVDNINQHDRNAGEHLKSVDGKSWVIMYMLSIR